MAQFDVYRNKNQESNDIMPFLLDIQADFLDQLLTRAVVPLALNTYVIKPIKILNPSFQIKHKAIVMLTQELAGIATDILGEKVTSLAKHRQEIIAALDFLITGF